MSKSCTSDERKTGREGEAVATAERTLDPKIAIFKVPQLFNYGEFGYTVFETVLRQGTKKAIETI